MVYQFHLIRNGKIIMSDSESGCYSYGKDNFPDGQWAVMTMDEYIEAKAQITSPRRENPVMSNIASNTVSGRADSYMQRPNKYYKKRRARGW